MSRLAPACALMAVWVVTAAVVALLVFPSAAYAQTSASPHTYATRYDAAGRVTGTIAPDPDGTGALKFAAVRNTYDPAGRLTKVETGELSSWKSEAVAPSAWGTAFKVLSSVETLYDAGNRKTRETGKGSDGAVIALIDHKYDSTGRLECTAQRMQLVALTDAPTFTAAAGAS